MFSVVDVDVPPKGSGLGEAWRLRERERWTRWRLVMLESQTWRFRIETIVRWQVG